jgi:ParB-like chromosome segregation protein Spo0J
MVASREAWVHPDALTPNPWNPNRMDDFMFRKEIESIKAFGFVVPIVVRSVPSGLEIIDGEHRWRAAQQLKLERIPIWDLGRISDVDAKQLTIVLNETRGQPDKDKLAALIRDLQISEPTHALMTVLPFTEQAFAELAALPQFDWQQLEHMSSAPGSPAERSQWIERVYRLPKDVAEVLDQALARVKANVKRELDDELSDWQALEVLAADYLAGA